MRLNYIKRIFSLSFLAVLISLLFVACPSGYREYPYRYEPYSGWTKYGLIYLTVLAPDGEPAIKDIDSDRFRIQFSGKSSYTKYTTVINAEDRLIYILGRIPIYVRDVEQVTDQDVKKALDNEELGFALRDTKDEYTTVVTTYKACYRDHKEYKDNQKPSTHYEENIRYIYNCEIKLTKKP